MDLTIKLTGTMQLRIVPVTIEQRREFYKLVEDDRLLDAYILFLQDGQGDPNSLEIGVVWQGLYGWNTVPFARDIGHDGFDTLEEATMDLYSVWKEWNG